MSTDTKTLSTPAVSDLVSSVTAHLQRFPKSQRADALSAITRNLHEHEATELKYAWPPDVAPSHSPDRADALVHAVTDLILNRNPINFW